MKGYVKIDRNLLALIDRQRPLSRFDAAIDIIQLMTAKDLIVPTHGVKVRLAKGQVILSVSDCMKRWNWNNRRSTQEFICYLIGINLITPVATISKVGTIYQVSTNMSTNMSTNNMQEINMLGNQVSTQASTENATNYLLYQERILSKKKNLSISSDSPTPEQWFRFINWAGQNIPKMARQITPELLTDMQRISGNNGMLAEALTWMEHKDISIDQYQNIINTQPWKDARR